MEDDRPAASAVESSFDKLRAVSRAEPLHARLKRGPLWGDGALATMLRAEGLGADEAPELWTLARPDVVAKVHAAYLAVGCDLTTTNTLGANRLRLKEFGLEGRLADINRGAVRIARGAGRGDHLVAGAMGPTGRFRRDRQTGSRSEVRSAFEEQASCLAEAGVDLLLLETMTHLEEASAGLEATRSCPPVPVGVTLVFFEEHGKLRTVDGATPGEAVRELAAADMVGCNCVEIEVGAAVLGEMHQRTTLPLIAQPHGGLPDNPRTPEAMARFVPALLASGAAIIGGCCGTTPAHLQAFIRVASAAASPS